MGRRCLADAPRTRLPDAHPPTHPVAACPPTHPTAPSYPNSRMPETRENQALMLSAIAGDYVPFFHTLTGECGQLRAAPGRAAPKAAAEQAQRGGLKRERDQGFACWPCWPLAHTPRPSSKRTQAVACPAILMSQLPALHGPIGLSAMPAPALPTASLRRDPDVVQLGNERALHTGPGTCQSLACAA